MFLKYIFLLLFLFNHGFAQEELLSRTKVLMGTFITISAPEKNKDNIQKGFDILSDVEMSLSSYNKQALVYRLNDERKVHLDHYLYEALILSKKYYQDTDGYFDIAIGSITKGLYRFGEEEHLPSDQDFQNANVNFKDLSFNSQEAWLDKNITLDLGGMGKGFGVDKVADYFKSNNITKAIIAASGDIRCIGKCHMNVQNPYSDNYLASFDTVKNETGVSTSGNYNRYVESTKNNHLINPKLKKSEQNFTSITLISNLPSSDLDAFATAVSVMPKGKAYHFLNSRPIAYIILENSGKLLISKNISVFVKNLVIH